MSHKCHECGSKKVKFNRFYEALCYDCGAYLDGDPMELANYAVKDG